MAASAAPPPPLAVPGPGERVGSPCIGVCRIDRARGLCEGCWRRLDEIAAWSQLDEAQRLEVWRALAGRAAEAAAPPAGGR